MIIHQVHSRDVAQMLLRSDAASVTDFQWQANKRYYYFFNNHVEQEHVAKQLGKLGGLMVSSSLSTPVPSQQ